MATVKALKYHTLHGHPHDVGDTYDVDDHEVDNLVGQGMVTRVDAGEPPAPKASEPVEPITTDHFWNRKG